MAPTLFDHDAKPGDLIEIYRGSFEHWAVYIGGNEVVHMTPPSADTDDNSGALDLFMFMGSSTAQVKQEKLWEVVGSNHFRINNLLDGEYRPRDREVIVREACRMVGQERPYCVATRNCEHFVTELRYGKPESRQVQTAAVIGGVAVAGVGLALLGAALFSSFGKDDNKRQKSRKHK